MSHASATRLHIYITHYDINYTNNNNTIFNNNAFYFIELDIHLRLLLSVILPCSVVNRRKCRRKRGIAHQRRSKLFRLYNVIAFITVATAQCIVSLFHGSINLTNEFVVTSRCGCVIAVIIICCSLRLTDTTGLTYHGRTTVHLVTVLSSNCRRATNSSARGVFSLGPSPVSARSYVRARASFCESDLESD